MRTLLIGLTALTGLSGPCFSQTGIKESDIRRVETNYQSCLDKGTSMVGCSKRFYISMDSCLNAVYKQLREKLDDRSKTALKIEQLDWLKARDFAFQKIDRTIKEEGRDGEMFRLDEKAEFIKDRVLILIRRLHK